MRSVVEAVFANSRLYPSKNAVIYCGAAITYSELAKKTREFAYALKTRKIAKGSRIVIEADNLISYFCALLGCQLYGCIAVPMERSISIYKLQDLLKSTKPKLVFMKNNGEDYDDYMQPVPENVKEFSMPKEDAVGIITGTTGTTGRPSLVSHTNRSLSAVVENLIEGTEITVDTVLFTNIPFELAAGYRRVIAALYRGATAVVCDSEVSLKDLYQYCVKYGLNHLSFISSDLSVLTGNEEYAGCGVDAGELDRALCRIKHVESVAGELTSETIAGFYQKFPEAVLYNVYGTTESGCILINNTRENHLGRCLGRPSRYAEISLIDENGTKITEPGKYGYVTVAGDMNMHSYYRKKDLTEQVMSDGKIILNDIVYFDGDGYYYFVSRVGDIINVKGHKVTPSRIENTAMQSGEIRDCACVARYDSNSGQIPVLYVECGDEKNFDPSGLIAYLNDNLESYCVPGEIIPINKIPRTVTGKLMRKSLPFIR